MGNACMRMYIMCLRTFGIQSFSLYSEKAKNKAENSPSPNVCTYVAVYTHAFPITFMCKKLQNRSKRKKTYISLKYFRLQCGNNYISNVPNLFFGRGGALSGNINIFQQLKIVPKMA